ncbi:MAG: hypothetical protein HY921_03885 [Elusimicrobia bacterium]|nr:hypothetical protein [Elusimicrobiota bacterium]
MEDITPQAPPAPAEPRKLGALLKASFGLAKAGLGETALIVGAGLLPGFVLMSAVMAMTGLTSKESLREALMAGQLGALLLIPVALISKMIQALAFMALIFSLYFRDKGEALDFQQSYSFSFQRFWPFALTQLRALLYIVLGYILLIVPGVILSIRYCFVHLSVLLEGYVGPAALARSKQIAIAHMGKVVGNLIAASLAVMLTNMLVMLALRLGSGLALTVLPQSLSFAGGQAASFISEWAGGIVGSWIVAFSILLYKDLSALHPAGN